jgi:hypothetical protein
MRALIWVTVLLGALWAGIWWFASGAALQGAQALIDGSDGQVSAADVSVSGFPNRVDLTLTEVTLKGPDQSWTAPFLQVFAMTWKPWQLIGVLPPGSQLRTPSQDITLNGTKMRGSATLTPTKDLALSDAIVEGHGLELSSTLGWQVTAEGLFGAAQEDLTQKNAYRVGLTLRNIGFDTTMAQSLSSLGLPQVLAQIHLDAKAVMSSPLDRFSGQSNPRIETLGITDLSFDWGTAKGSIVGDLLSGTDGFAEGELRIHVQDWRKVLALGVLFDALTQDQADLLGRGFAEIAKGAAGNETIDVTLTAAGGLIYFGALPIGPAPRLR